MSGPTISPPVAGSSRRWWGLLAIALGQLMITLDVTIVNVGLPTIQAALDITDANRQWAITAYTLAFAGLLLLGGRIADHVGRKRVFVIALVGFAVASVLGGAATNMTMLVVARAAQGAFGALLAPAALSLLSTTFSGPRERGTAFAVYTGVASGGLPVGLILGGVLTEYLSWNWVFYINVPIALAAAVGAAFLLDESRSPQRVRFDVLGAVLATAGLVALVYGFSAAADGGWGAPLTLGMLVGGVVILVAFVFSQQRIAHPLLPLRIVTDRNRAGAYLAFLMVFVGVFGLFLFVSFYLQTVNGYQPAAAGVAFLPMAFGVIGATMVVSRIITRIQPRLLLAGGMLASAAGMAWLTQLGVGSGYATGVLPALILVGAGTGVVAPVAVNLATLGVSEQDTGVASASLNTSQQVGASLGTALLNTIAATGAAAYVASHAPGPEVRLTAQVEGFAQATTWAAGILVVAAVITLISVRANLGAAPARNPSAEEDQDAGALTPVRSGD